MVKRFLHKVKLDWTACLHVCIRELRVDAASSKAEAGASADGCSLWLFLKGLRCLGSCSVISQLRLSWHGENKLNSLLSLLCLHQTFKRAEEMWKSTMRGTQAPWEGLGNVQKLHLQEQHWTKQKVLQAWKNIHDQHYQIVNKKQSVYCWRRHGNKNIETLLFKQKTKKMPKET